MSDCKDRFYLYKNTYPGIIFPDRADPRNLEDGAVRGGGGRHRERSMHASLHQAKYFLRAEWNHGVEFKDM